jgi:hypothetical protein
VARSVRRALRNQRRSSCPQGIFIGGVLRFDGNLLDGDLLDECVRDRHIQATQHATYTTPPPQTQTQTITGNGTRGRLR